MGPLNEIPQDDVLGDCIRVYLLHFDQNIRGTNHYIGSAKATELENRLRRHQQGTGSSYTRQMHKIGASFYLANLWNVPDRKYEEKLKQAGKFKRHCIICNPLRNVPPLFADVRLFTPIARSTRSPVASW